ncbi:DAK2 domain-containing protein [Lachnoanaerobaculum sp. OBRC5-5]|uniref:DAK2 domain-containing protein n=1 Tax=Lachnoanaerobaculum sp. OBRC5-5 TaxID=936595 RepID=UPI0002824F56|nr:DAK2 domain-containing protein [Lachnoanaerobaculum sp. OBRC5-5]EJZ71305.1 DAK2 domain fusion protein YloV [Lachnoanaerobaculum sp. OBRC5-5]
MSLEQIDAQSLKSAFITGAKSLEAKKEWINELNVFPVPDGDTGTNMTMTIMSAAKTLAAEEGDDIASMCKAIAQGSLRGARGNSGVILSQLFRGAAKILKESPVVDVFEIALAFDKASETAYKAVMKPKEGTILTVARAMGEKALEIHDEYDDIIAFLEAVLAYGDETLKKTPEMLPVLKKAGVVDSGGQGLMVILHGILEGLKGNVIELGDVVLSTKTEGSANGAAREDIDTSDIKFGYCTEFIVNLNKEFTDKDEEEFKEFLTSIGDSLVCVADDEVVKIHVHTNDPGLAIQRGLTFGELTNLKIDNMREEHRERVIKGVDQILESQKKKKKMGVISVSAGSGLTSIFKEIGVDVVVEGGQTMNPSTEDILNAVEHLNAETIYILPNNKNIILAAEQAAKIVEDKKVVVIPTKTIPQGITAMISLSEDRSAEENLENATEEISNVKSAQITYAVRNTTIDDVEIHENDVMALGDSGIIGVDKSIDSAVDKALANMIDDSSELVCLYYGEEVSEEDATKLCDELVGKYENVEFELHFGGQPVYYYFISVE